MLLRIKKRFIFLLLIGLVHCFSLALGKGNVDVRKVEESEPPEQNKKNKGTFKIASLSGEELRRRSFIPQENLQMMARQRIEAQKHFSSPKATPSSVEMSEEERVIMAQAESLRAQHGGRQHLPPSEFHNLTPKNFNNNATKGVKIIKSGTSSESPQEEVLTSKAFRKSARTIPDKNPKYASYYVDAGSFLNADDAAKVSQNLSRILQMPIEPTRNVGNKNYTIQIGPLTKRKDAEVIVDKLVKQKYYDVEIVE